MVSVSDTCPFCKKEATLSNKFMFKCKHCDKKLDIYIGNGSICGIDWNQKIKYVRMNTGWKIIILD
jgi:hypothetical protein